MCLFERPKFQIPKNPGPEETEESQLTFAMMHSRRHELISCTLSWNVSALYSDGDRSQTGLVEAASLEEMIGQNL